MKKRLIAAIVAGAMALLGVVVLVAWAKNANDRAFEGADLVKVIRVTAPVESGTRGSELGGSTEVAELPADAVPDGAVTQLGDVSNLAVTTSLVPGEILLRTRLAAPGEKGKGATDVPKGFQEITVALDLQRTVGGSIKAGDRVGVFASFKPEDNKVPDFTSLVRHNVLVTSAGGPTATDAAGIIMITLAVETQDAEKIVLAMEYGKVWLTAQNADTNKSGEKVITGEDFLK